MEIINSLLLLCCFLVPVIAVRRSNTVIVNPMTLLALQVLIGVTVKGLLMVWSWDSFNSRLLYWAVDRVVTETVIFTTLFIVFVSYFYTFGKKKYDKSDLADAMIIANRKPLYLKRTVLLSILIFVVTAVIFLTQKGFGLGEFLSSEGFHSVQRNRSIRIDDVRNFGATFAATALFLKFGLFLFVSTAVILYSNRSSGSLSKTIVFWLKIGLLFSFVCIMLEIVVTGRRTFIVSYLLLGIGIASMLSFRTFFNIRKVLTYGILGTITLFLFGLLTLGRQGSDLDNVAAATSADSLIGTVIYGEYFLSISKLTVFIDSAVGVGLLYGSSYLDWIAGLVPRVFWPDKPAITLGPFIKAEFYGFSQGISGIPPTIIGESFLNFGWFGLLLAPFIGTILRKFEDFLLRPDIVAYKDGHIWYFCLIFPISYNMYQSSFSAAMINVISQCGLLYIFLRLLRGR